MLILVTKVKEMARKLSAKKSSMKRFYNTQNAFNDLLLWFWQKKSIIYQFSMKISLKVFVYFQNYFLEGKENRKSKIEFKDNDQSN